MANEWLDGSQKRWEIHKVLDGGMGTVYIVYDHELREPLAAKTFQDELFKRNPMVAERFTQEALAWTRLDWHENIAQARCVESIEGKPFLFLEYVSGGDLSTWIGTPRLSEDLPQVLRFAIQFCDGMSHALSKGIQTHRDIKPGNCLITEDHTLKVTDFGLAKVFDEARPPGGPGREVEAGNAPGLSIGATRTGTGAGTPPYMAPEQFDDAKHVDVRADVYSFGVMLYEMLAGRLPFQGRTWQELERLHKTQPPPPLVGCHPSLVTCHSSLVTCHPSLVTVVHTCLAKDPAARYANFDVLRARLAEIYESLTGEAAPRPRAGTDLDAVDFNNKGVSLANLGRHEEALTCYERALEINPRDGIAWSNKGVALADLGRHAEALTCFERALEISPRYLTAWSNKGLALKKLGRHAEALTCYERALQINPRLAEAWSDKGVALADLGRHAEVLTCFERALEIDPHDAKAWSNKGVALGKLGRHDEALTCYERALEINPRKSLAWSNKGVALADLGRPAEALTCYQRALEINPRDPEAWYNRGVALAKLGRPAEALTCYEWALEINPRFPEAWFNKGVVLGNTGRYPEALACFEQAQQAGHPQAAEAIAVCRRKLGM